MTLTCFHKGYIIVSPVILYKERVGFNFLIITKFYYLLRGMVISRYIFGDSVLFKEQNWFLGIGILWIKEHWYENTYLSKLRHGPL